MKQLTRTLLLLCVWFTRPYRREQVERLACKLYREQYDSHSRRRWYTEGVQPAVILGGVR